MKLWPLFQIDVLGEPKGQPRARAFSAGGKARLFTPGTAEAWKGQIAAAVRTLLPAEPLAVPVKLRMVFYMPRPKRLCRKKDPDGPVPFDARPDWDNLEKAVGDALQELRVFDDDKRVYACETECYYHSKGGRPGATIRVSYLAEKPLHQHRTGRGVAALIRDT